MLIEVNGWVILQQAVKSALQTQIFRVLNESNWTSHFTLRVCVLETSTGVGGGFAWSITRFSWLSLGALQVCCCAHVAVVSAVAAVRARLLVKEVSERGSLS